MSLVTFEVDIDHGRVTPRGLKPLPEKGTGLLTLLPELPDGEQGASVSDFLAKWSGAFSLPESRDDDLRLTYLLGKHVK